MAHIDTPRVRGETEMPHVSPVTPAEDARTVLINRISWGAVFAGLVTILVAQLLLNMLGVGVGVASFDPGAADNPAASTFSLAAAAWWTVAGVIASFFGGYVAGRVSGVPTESSAGWHGMIAWAAATLVMFYILTSTIGSLVGGAFSALQNTAGGIARGAGSAIQTAATGLAAAADPFAAIEQQIRGTGQDPAALQTAAIAAVRRVLSGEPAQVEIARAQAIEALARAQGISPDEARNRIQGYEQQFRTAVQEARREATAAADTATRVVSRGALLGALALLLGGIAAWFGGRAGAVDPTITSAFLRRSPSITPRT